VKYRQAIAIIDTADPILFRFPPRADNGDSAIPPPRQLDQPLSLAEAIEEMNDCKERNRPPESEWINESPILASANTPDSRPEVRPEETYLTTNDFDEPAVPQTEADNTPPRLVIVPSEKDPNQIELPLEIADEEESCAA
jgi:hypothetical protein